MWSNYCNSIAWLLLISLQDIKNVWKLGHTTYFVYLFQSIVRNTKTFFIILEWIPNEFIQIETKLAQNM